MASFRVIFCSALVLASALLSFQAQADTAAQAQRSLLLDVLETDKGTLLAAGERGHILRSTDKGQNWSLVETPGKLLLTSLTSTQGALLAGGHNTSILRSTDDGQSWVSIFDTKQLPEDDPARDSAVLDIDCFAPPACEAVGGYGLWLRSQDNGARWTRAYIKEDDRHGYALLALTDGFLLAQEAGGLMKYDATVQDWLALSPPAGGSIFGLVRDSQNAILAFGLSGRFLRSVDEGTSWSEIKTGISTGLMGATTLRDGTTLLVGASGALLSWNPLSSDFMLQRLNHRKTFNQTLQTRNQTIWLVGENGLSEHKEAYAGQ